jgi:tetratricopeptide (TPR) repeat protein
MRFFRFSWGISEAEFARRARVAPQVVGRWENGDVPISRDLLVELLGEHLDVPPEAVDAALHAHLLSRLPAETAGPVTLSLPEHRLLGRAAVTGAQSGAEAARRELARQRLRRRVTHHDAWAADLWSSLKKLQEADQARVLAVLAGDERSWCLAVRLCHASETAAAHSAAESLRLARLAAALAEKIPGPEKWRLRLLGYCEPFLANALRVGGSLSAAEEAFAQADDHWQQGEGGDPLGLLDSTRRLDLKASLFKHQGRFEEALVLLDQAVKGVRTDHERGRLLLKRAFTLEQAGDYEAALETLGKAEPLIDIQLEPRLEWVLQFNRGVAYCHLDRFQDAESLLPLVEALAADLRTDLDAIRTRWLKARTQAGLGHWEKALAGLSQVRRFFHTEQIAYDYALVTLELVTLYLERGRTRTVKEMTEEMLWIFEGEKVHREALAALALFLHAAEREEAQADWTRRLVKYLYRAQHNSQLRFEP